MIKRVLVLFLVVLSGSMLFGCQLAVENAAMDVQNDRFIGFYVTRSIELYNYDGQKKNSTGARQKAIYATAKPVIIGESETVTFEFDGIEGIAFFHATVFADNQRYNTSILGPEVFDSNLHISVSDETDETTLTGKAYIPLSVNLDNFYLAYNPVYQTTDGEVYLLPGDNYGSGGSVGMENTLTITENGKTVKKATEASLTVESINTPVKTVFKQINDQDKIVETTVVLPQEAPDVIRLNADTAYIIVEEHGINAKNQTEIVRTLLNNDTIIFICKYIGENGFAIGERIEIQR